MQKDDVIYRQAAIDEICLAWCSRKYDDCVHILDFKLGCYFCDGCSDVQTIMDLSSAQPDLDEWCTDCKEYDQERHSCPRWNRVIRKAVDELRAEQAERREENDQYTGNKLAEGLRAKPG